MKEERQERLFRAIGDVGADLVDMAEKQTFAPSRWRKWGSLAACLAVILCLGVLAMPYFPSGCGSSTNETAAPGYSGAMEEAAAESPESEPEQPESTEDAVYEAEGAAVRTRFVFRYTYYYFRDQAPSESPANLGEYLGEVEACDDESLVGCPVYRCLNSTEFDNHSVNGLTVPEEVWVETGAGYRYAITLNEKTVSRYTLDNVVNHLGTGDDTWLLETFAEPLYRMDDFSDPSELSSEQLNTLLTLTRGMNTGINATALWLQDEGFYEVPVEEAQWRVSRFLDADRYAYTPKDTAAYDEGRDALVFESLPLTALEQEVLLLDDVALVDDNLLYLRVSAYEYPGSQDLTEDLVPQSTREFLIRFDEDSWRYLSITTVDPVG